MRLLLLLLTFACILPTQAAEEILTGKLNRPWGMAFVSDHQILISERGGTLQLFDIRNGQLQSVDGAPEVVFDGQGGLLDVAVAPDYYRTGWIYFTWSHPVNDRLAATALGRAKLPLKSGPLQLQNWQTLLVTQSASTTRHHYGSRIAFDKEHVYFSVGDRGDRSNGQNRKTHAGSILRLNRDGSVPADNPFIADRESLPEIWSYGHRNPQGLAWDEGNQRLWAIEHGPRGGDEINLIEKGINYGWAEVSWGKEYWNPMYVGEARSKAGMKDPVKMYDPSIAPGSLLFYQGKAIPQWQGNLLAGALKLQHLNRVTLEGSKATGEQRLLGDLKERLRALTSDKQGRVYIASDSGRLYRLSSSPDA